MGSSLIPQFLPLRKCACAADQVRGHRGQALIVPHILLWCHHHHTVSPVTAIWRATLLGQGSRRDKMNDGLLYPSCCQMCPAAAHFHQPSTHHHKWPHGVWPTHSVSQKQAKFGPPTRCTVHTGTRKTKLFPRRDATQLQMMNTRSVGAQSCSRPTFPPLQSWSWHSYGSWEAKRQSWRTAYEKKTNVLQGALRLELLFSLLWFIGSIVTSSLPVLNVPLICSSRICTWNNSLKMNERKAKH